MERIIASFKADKRAIASNDEHIGEIIIDGNSIEFYVRDTNNPFVHAYIGGDGHYGYTVFVNDSEYKGRNKTLDNSSSYRVLCVLKSARIHEDPIETENVTEVSFTIPELIPWINMKTVSYEQISMTEAIGIEEELEDVVLLDNEDTEVRFAFSSKTCKNAMENWSSTSITVEKVPEIHIKYHNPVSLERIRSDIQMNMEFWGIIIGHVSTAENILVRFSCDNELEGHNCKLMYFNADYSYNLRAVDLFHRVTTDYKLLKDSISSLYEGWSEFFHDEKFYYIRNNFFMVNRKAEPFLEDVFVTYVRILEGYELRISGDDNIRVKIEDQIRGIEKNIKDSIREDEIKNKIENAIKPIIPDWSLNSSHAGELARWIANGYIGKVSLETRIKRLDDNHLNIIAKNKTIIEEANSGACNAEDYYSRITKTRNYYSHFKEDDTGILSIQQMIDTVKVLKGLIMLIFYENMGLNSDDARKILIRNSELAFETQCLMSDEEKRIPRASDAVIHNLLNEKDETTES
ncbi:MAG: hypothetical protein J5525_05940 [Lachnospiraceae bacterium]|nr:hypothetical protein [Lachnospiraceae bacterium]